MSDGGICVVTSNGSIDIFRQSELAEKITLTDKLAHAVAGDCEWLWLLGAGAQPRADALRLLLDAGQDADVTSGIAVDADARMLVEQLPAVTARSLEDLVQLADRSLLPIRSTPFANALVRRVCFERHGLPNVRRYGRWAPVAWSAAVLRERAGYFVPASVVQLERAGGERTTLADAPAVARMLRSGAWTRGDALVALRLRRSR